MASLGSLFCLFTPSTHPKKSQLRWPWSWVLTHSKETSVFCLDIILGIPLGTLVELKKKKKIFLVTIHASKYKTLTKFLPTYLEVGFSSLNDQKEKLAGGKITPSGTCDKTIKKLTNFPN